MMRNFRTYSLAVEFYRLCSTLTLPRHLKEQLFRAAQSIALNLCEGRGRPTVKDQVRFFHIAMGSVRECQGILILAQMQHTFAWTKLDRLAAHLYRLIEKANGG